MPLFGDTLPNMAKGATQKERAARTREALIDAALAAFGERGVKATGIREVARRAEVSTGLVYHYFPDKRALLRAVLQERSFLPELERLAATPPQTPVEETLALLGERFLALLEQRRDVVAIFVGEAFSDPEARAARDEMIDRGLGFLGGYLAAEVERGALRPHASRTLARAFLGSVLAAFLMGATSEDLPRELARAMVKGLAP